MFTRFHATPWICHIFLHGQAGSCSWCPGGQISLGSVPKWPGGASDTLNYTPLVHFPIDQARKMWNIGNHGKHGEANDFDLCSSPFVFCSLEIATAKEIDPYGIIWVCPNMGIPHWYHQNIFYFDRVSDQLPYFFSGVLQLQILRGLCVYIYITNYQKLYILVI